MYIQKNKMDGACSACEGIRCIIISGPNTSRYLRVDGRIVKWILRNNSESGTVIRLNSLNPLKPSGYYTYHPL
jgi:hypothetical protein